MSVLNRIDGALQYDSIGGSAACFYLHEWATEHASVIRQVAGNGHALNVLVPPHEEGCVAQVDVEYHIETDTQQEFTDLFDDLTAAIYSGTAAPFATAGCDSGWGQSTE